MAFTKLLNPKLLLSLLFGSIIGRAEGQAPGPEVLDRPQNIDMYSFDFSAHQLPLAYNTYGSSVQLHSKYKLIPDVKNRYGAIVLNKYIQSDRKYEIDVEFQLKSPDVKSHGFAIFLTGQEPSFPEEFHPSFGYRPDYKGLGVFLYRSEKKNKWVSTTECAHLTISCAVVRYFDPEQGAQEDRGGQERWSQPRFLHQQEDLVRIRHEHQRERWNQSEDSDGLHLRLQEGSQRRCRVLEVPHQLDQGPVLPPPVHRLEQSKH